MIKGTQKKICERSFANKLGKLAQGIRGVKGENKGMFIPKYEFPKDKKVTYGKIVCEVKQEKEEKEKARLTVGGNLLDFTGNISAPTASVAMEKFVFNSVVSTPGARCLLADIKHFYLNNISPDPDFIHIPLKIIPQEIIDTYDFKALVDDQGWIYMRIEKGMYGLKYAGIIANQELVKNMATFGYHTVKHTPNLWQKTFSSLVVDNFCVQYCSTEDADHFLNSLRSK